MWLYLICVVVLYRGGTSSRALAQGQVSKEKGKGEETEVRRQEEEQEECLGGEMKDNEMNDNQYN